MRLYNVIDDLNRFVRFSATLESGVQCNSHTYSYLFMREYFQERGEVMGLDSLVLDNDGECASNEKDYVSYVQVRV